jgi:hypothetical protein
VLLANGARIRLYGGDNPDRLRGIYLDGVVLDEVADMTPSLWSSVLRPALADRGGWAVFIGTPRGKNVFWELWDEAGRRQDWFKLELRASETGILSADEIADISANISPDEVQQELECSADAMRTMAAEGRICELAIDPDVRVHTGWDLGISDSTAIWFVQCVGRERRLVDYYEASGVGLEHYVDVLVERRLKHGYKYGEHFFPHDIKARELTSGKSRLKALAELGIEATVVPESNVLDGINVTRRLLSRVWIDPVRCQRGLEALRQYRRDCADFRGAPPNFPAYPYSLLVMFSSCAVQVHGSW